MHVKDGIYFQGEVYQNTVHVIINLQLGIIQYICVKLPIDPPIR